MYLSLALFMASCLRILMAEVWSLASSPMFSLWKSALSMMSCAARFRYAAPSLRRKNFSASDTVCQTHTTPTHNHYITQPQS